MLPSASRDVTVRPHTLAPRIERGHAQPHKMGCCGPLGDYCVQLYLAVSKGSQADRTRANAFVSPRDRQPKIAGSGFEVARLLCVNRCCARPRSTCSSTILVLSVPDSPSTFHTPSVEGQQQHQPPRQPTPRTPPHHPRQTHAACGVWLTHELKHLRRPQCATHR